MYDMTPVFAGFGKQPVEIYSKLKLTIRDKVGLSVRGYSFGEYKTASSGWMGCAGQASPGFGD
jgi:hypothetical protein